MDDIKSLHRGLLGTLDKEMTDEDFRSFRSHAQGKGLRQGEASKCSNVTDVLDKLQRKGKIKPGYYQVLKDIFMDMEQSELIELVEETEEKLRDAGCEISSEIPQTQDRPPFKRQGSSTEDLGSAGKRRSSWGQRAGSGSGYSFDGPSSGRRQSAQSHSSFEHSDDNGAVGHSSLHNRPSKLRSRNIPKRDPTMFEEREDRYKTGKGFVLLINNFSREREASTNDVEGLVDFFQNIGYKVSTEEDLNKEQMIDALAMAKLEIQKKSRGKDKYTSFICIVSSHGDKEGVKSQDKEIVTMAELQAPFMGDSLACLAGSPKIFLIQACRGKKKQPPVDRADEEPGDEGQMDMSDVMRSLTTPKDADVLVAYATTEGCLSFRRLGEGSWFLSEMLDVFKVNHQVRGGSDHLLDMLTEVNDRVSHRQTVSSKPAKQMPVQVSTLTKKFYF